MALNLDLLVARETLALSDYDFLASQILNC
jgi:hypothetical protein